MPRRTRPFTTPSPMHLLIRPESADSVEEAGNDVDDKRDDDGAE